MSASQQSPEPVRRGASPTVKALKHVSNVSVGLAVVLAVASFLMPTVVDPIFPVSVFILGWTAAAWSMALRFIARTPADRRTPKNLMLTGRESGLLFVVMVVLSIFFARNNPALWVYTALALVPALVFIGVSVAGKALGWPSPNQVDEIVLEPLGKAVLASEDTDSEPDQES